MKNRELKKTNKPYYSKKEKDSNLVLGIVLAECESESSPGTIHQIRKSHADGKTHCTCTRFHIALRTGGKTCWHFAKYLSESTEPVSVYKSVEEFDRRLDLGSAELTASTEMRRAK